MKPVFTTRKIDRNDITSKLEQAEKNRQGNIKFHQINQLLLVLQVTTNVGYLIHSLMLSYLKQSHIAINFIYLSQKGMILSAGK